MIETTVAYPEIISHRSMQMRRSFSRKYESQIQRIKKHRLSCEYAQRNQVSSSPAQTKINVTSFFFCDEIVIRPM